MSSEGAAKAGGDNRRRNNNKRGRGGGGRGKGRRGRGGNKDQGGKEATLEIVAQSSDGNEAKASAEISAATPKQDGRGRRGQGSNKEKSGKLAAASTVVESSVADEPMAAARSDAPAKENATLLEPLPPDSAHSWFVASLKNLSHFDPSSVESAMEVHEDPKTADSQLVSLTLWLEDRLIRSWKLDERQKLREDFWAHINTYLDGLECPEDYFPEFFFADEDKKTPHWRYSSSHRQKIVYWLILNSTSEAFGDISSQQMADPSPAAPVAARNNEVESGASNCKEAEGSQQENPFPLGFSTGDDQVDHIVSLLRMKLLIQLEEDQKAVNEAVCLVQGVTSGKARPLKQAKLRPNNIKKPPPERRGGRGRGGGGGGRGRGRRRRK